MASIQNQIEELRQKLAAAASKKRIAILAEIEKLEKRASFVSKNAWSVPVKEVVVSAKNAAEKKQEEQAQIRCQLERVRLAAIEKKRTDYLANEKKFYVEFNESQKTMSMCEQKERDELHQWLISEPCMNGIRAATMASNLKINADQMFEQARKLGITNFGRWKERCYCTWNRKMLMSLNFTKQMWSKFLSTSGFYTVEDSDYFMYDGPIPGGEVGLGFPNGYVAYYPNSTTGNWRSYSSINEVLQSLANDKVVFVPRQDLEVVPTFRGYFRDFCGMTVVVVHAMPFIYASPHVVADTDECASFCRGAHQDQEELNYCVFGEQLALSWGNRRASVLFEKCFQNTGGYRSATVHLRSFRKTNLMSDEYKLHHPTLFL